MKIVMDFDYDCDVSTLFDYLSDVNAIPRLSGANSQRVVDGDDSPNGVGAVRTITAAGGLVSLDECIRTCEENSLIEYEIVRGTGIKSHWGRMEFSQVGEKSHLHYEITLNTATKITDFLITKALQTGLTKGLKKLRTTLK